MSRRKEILWWECSESRIAILPERAILKPSTLCFIRTMLCMRRRRICSATLQGADPPSSPENPQRLLHPVWFYWCSQCESVVSVTLGEPITTASFCLFVISKIVQHTTFSLWSESLNLPFVRLKGQDKNAPSSTKNCPFKGWSRHACGKKLKKKSLPCAAGPGVPDSERFAWRGGDRRAAQRSGQK